MYSFILSLFPVQYLREAMSLKAHNSVSLSAIYNSTRPKQHKRLDKLLKSTVERRAERLDVLVEVDGELRTLGDALWGELEFLQGWLAYCLDT